MANTTNDIRNAKQLASFVREEDLEDMDKLRVQIEDLAHQARQDGRVYLLAQYTRLLATVNPEIDRIKKRFQRENLAFLRKEEKRLKEEIKSQREADGLA
jgi:hypothetical protein